MTTLRLQLTVISIKMSVRFPCSLSFRFDSDDLQPNDSSQSFPLKNGSCDPNCQISYSLTLTQEKPQKQVKLKIIMVTNKNSVPSGQILIPVSLKNIGQSITSETSILNCIDKNAKIQYSLTYQQVETPKVPEKNDQSKNSSSIYQRLESRLDRSSASKKVFESSYRPLTNNSSSRQTSGVKKRSRSKQNQSFRSPRPGNTQGSFRQNKYQNMSNSTSLQNNKPQYKSDPRFQQGIIAEGHYTRLKTQIDAQVLENQGLREQVMNMEWRERELNQECKQARDQLENARQKFHQSELLIIEYQSQLSQREKVIKEMQIQLQSMQQKCNDYEININSLTKKLEYKEEYYKEQLEALTQKYNASEQQKQKSFFEMNEMLNNLQTIEHKHQQSNKEKDLAYIEEKSGLLKKIDQLTRQLNKLQQNNELKMSDLDDMMIEKKKIENKLNEAEQSLDQLKQQLKKLQILLTKQQENTKSLSRELALLQQADTDLANSKRTIQDLHNEISTLKRELESNNKSSKSQLAKNKQTQDKLLKKSQEVIQLQSKLSSVSSELSSLKKKQIQLQKEIEFLTNTNAQSNTKIEELKNRYDQLQKSVKEVEKKMEEQKAYDLKIREGIAKQLEEEKLKLKKSKTVATDKESKNMELTKEIQDKDRRIKGLEEQNERLRIELGKLKNEQMLLNEDQQSSRSKQKQLQESIVNLSKKIEKQQNQIQELEGLNRQLEETMSDRQLKYSERITKEQNMNRYLQGKVQQKQSENRKLQEALRDKNTENQSVNQILQKVKEELEYYKEEELGARKSNNQNTNKIQLLNQEMSRLTKQIQKKDNELDHKEKELNELKEKWKRLGQNAGSIEKQYNKFKSDAISSLASFMKEIENSLQPAGSPKGKKNNVKAFPDSEIQKKQIQLLETLKIAISEYNSEISTLSNEKQKLEKDLSNSSATQSKRIKDLEKSQEELTNRNNKQSQDINRINSEKFDLKNKLDKLEEEKKKMEKQYSANISKRDKEIQGLKDSLEHSSSSSSSAIENLKKEVLKTKTELAASVDKQKQATKQLKQFEKDLTQTNQVLKNKQLSYDAQIQKLSRDLSTKEEECKSQKITITSQLAQLKQLRNQNTILNSQLNKNQKINESAANTVSRLEKRIADLEKELKQINDEWDQERNLYIPIGDKFEKLKTEIGRCHTATGEIEKNSKTLLEVSKKRARDDQIIRQSAGQVLRDIQSGLMKLKTRILNKYVKLFDQKEIPKDNKPKNNYLSIDTSRSMNRQRKSSFLTNKLPTNERQEVLYDFKAIQEKLESAIRSYQILVV